MKTSPLGWTAALVSLIGFALSGSPASATSYDLTADWSDESNPNGLWSYNWNNVPLPSVYRDSDPWDVPQISWGDLPGWFRSNGTEQFEHDWLLGDVITHTPYSSEGYSDIDWTCPSEGHITISGAVWPCRDWGRWVEWLLVVDGVLITGGEVGSGDPYSRDHPMDFVLGSGGPDVLVDIPVRMDDRVELRCSEQDVGDYCGVRMTIEFTPATQGVPWEPSPETTWGDIKALYR